MFLCFVYLFQSEGLCVHRSVCVLWVRRREKLTTHYSLPFKKDCTISAMYKLMFTWLVIPNSWGTAFNMASTYVKCNDMLTKGTDQLRREWEYYFVLLNIQAKTTISNMLSKPPPYTWWDLSIKTVFVRVCMVYQSCLLYTSRCV